MKQVAKKEETTVVTRSPDLIAAEIRSIDQQARQFVLQSAIEIGRKLTEAKSLVAHGEWGSWLEANVNYKQSTANNFMRISEEYGNSQALGNLSYTQAVALLSVPAEDREQFAEDNNVEDMSTRELQTAIKDKQELERKLAEQKQEFDKWSDEFKADRDTLAEKYKTENNLRIEHEEKVRELEQEIEKAKKAGNSKETAKLKTELRKAEKVVSESTDMVKAAEEALKQKEAEIDKLIEDRLNQQKQELDKQAKQSEAGYTDQIKKLEQQLQRNNNEAFMKFKVHFEQFAAGFDTLIKSLAEVQDDAEQKKLKAALAKTVDKMKSAL